MNAHHQHHPFSLPTACASGFVRYGVLLVVIFGLLISSCSLLTWQAIFTPKETQNTLTQNGYRKKRHIIYTTYDTLYIFLCQALKHPLRPLRIYPLISSDDIVIQLCTTLESPPPNHPPHPVTHRPRPRYRFNMRSSQSQIHTHTHTTTSHIILTTNI